MPTVKVSIYHDTRRKKVSGLFPVKLRVYFDNERRDYGIYPDKERETPLDLSKDDFQKVMFSERPRSAEKELRGKLNAVQQRATDIAAKLPRFTFDAFDRRYLGAVGIDQDLIYQYGRYVAYLEKAERYSTASNYDLSLKSLQAFITHTTGRAAVTLPYSTITPEWLAEYETYMLGKGYSKATIGIYLRPLRALFNYALDPIDYTTKRRHEPIIDRAIYPFGSKQYIIPTGGKVKKSLDMEQLKTLFNYPTEPGTDRQKAKDFFFFSYVGNGMNIRDIALLKRKDVQGDIIVFERTKTIRSTKAEPVQIIVPIIDHTKHVISTYGNTDHSPESYLFQIVDNSMSAKERRIKAMAFTRYINQHIKSLAKDAGITGEISSNWGRHSFTTNAIRNGARLELIQESLGHKSAKTTQNYWAGFAENVKTDIANGLMNFNNNTKTKNNGSGK